ncbi:hypothetical protein [Streptomyces thermolilacinus]|uniref:Uncharacterized protein n=1 Tax=Streptomyces thermolilacinus SPC6 TaxID=1306406 RepID=A0A1D3DNG7_9ACTN|nr:hypothetical protein [Streptomyces thermolilacinus]OEJ93856.1 hypothetical protein J116_004605 [Streptomyces thermolilacinus SPC6]
MDNRAPGLRGLPRRQRWRYVALAGTLALGVFLAVNLAPVVVGLLTADTATQVQKEAEREADGRLPPFTAEVAYESYGASGTNFPDGTSIVLDRVLTADEQTRLTSLDFRDERFHQKVWELLEPLGARVVTLPSKVVGAPPGKGNSARTFQLRLHSDRARELSIVDLRATVEECSPPTARTVVSFASGGSAAIQGVVWYLASGVVVPLISDEDAPHAGEPFFRYHQIDLGDGASPGALRVESVADKESCSWHVDATYTDTEGTHGPVRHDGKPFSTEAVPQNPHLRFQVDLGLSGGLPWLCSGAVATGRCTFTPST